ncbi:MAG: hypothetical protein H5T34_01055 [Candidatus Methanomethyliales bacterium]|nr:hypothetical protein [Candidatus Methanomethylicales archaeon]
MAQVKIARFFANTGRFMENSGFRELSELTNVRALGEGYYWKDFRYKEAEFLAKGCRELGNG